MQTIELVILEGAMPSSVALTLDMLATVNRLRAIGREAAMFEVVLSGSGAAHWLPLVPSVLNVSNSDAMHVILPGLSLSSREEVETRLAKDDARNARSYLTTLPQHKTISTSCSGSFLLAQASLLDGKRATTSWWLAHEFRAMFPEVKLDTESLLVRDGSYRTAGAALAQMDLMLALVSDWAGPTIASQCSRYLLLDERRSQAHYMALSFIAASDPLVAAAERWVRSNIAQSFTVDEVAAAIGLAPRTFARRVAKVTGLSPIRFVQKIRVEVAVTLLETTRQPLEEIAEQVGYGDPAMLRVLIGEQTGLSPKQHRTLANARATVS
jgi:transcriptional regulator GlxA family with amidase domain